jgi:polyhydroxybutyrate depolymerase
MDNINHYEHQSDSPPYWRSGVEHALDGWVTHNQCNKHASEQILSQSTSKRSYKNCSKNTRVVFYKSNHAGHTWPGSPKAEILEKLGLGKTDTDISATELIWEFFIQ